MSRFHAVYDKLNHALDGLPYDEVGISVEVKEQVIPVTTCILFLHVFPRWILGPPLLFTVRYPQCGDYCGNI